MIFVNMLTLTPVNITVTLSINIFWHNKTKSIHILNYLRYRMLLMLKRFIVIQSYRSILLWHKDFQNMFRFLVLSSVDPINNL